MSPQTVEKRQAPGWRPEALKNVNLEQNYRSGAPTSRHLGQAADVLVLLTVFPLTATERLGLGMLFHHRLRRAYAGAGR